MKTVVIDRTDVRVSRVSFGTASLHHLLRAAERDRLLAAALDLGVSHFDTSPYYGDGLAEVDLGRCLASRRHEKSVATKVGIYPHARARSGWQVWLRRARGRLQGSSALPSVDWSLRRARESLQESLRRLRTDYVDFLFLHEPDVAVIDAAAFLEWLAFERQRGTIRHWGLAGLGTSVAPWLHSHPALAAVIQTRDDLVQRPADFLLRHERKFQFTYGYLAAVPSSSRLSVSGVMRDALERNAHGSVLVSTRRPERLCTLVAAAQ